MKSFLILFLVTSFLTAQKVVKKSIINTSISAIQIDASNCFEISIENSNSDIMTVSAIIDGEYKNDLVLNLKEEGTTVVVSAGFRPNFQNPNDKLSAHKVVSIALDIRIPINKNVNVYGTSCNIKVEGAYEKLKATLNDGTCSLFSVLGFADVSTQSGNILIESQAATIDCKSKYGFIEGEIIANSLNQYYLRTTTGNIHLKRIE
jgi:hypothetical protein